MKKTVKVGLGELETRMTREQAQRWGDANMPIHLRRVGFQTLICDCGEWFRINWGKP